MEAAIAQEFSRGVEQFNRGEFYACHDTLEALWMEADEPDRTFFQGVLQLAVGLYHLTNHNWQGAVTLLGNGISRLRPYTPEYDGTDVEHLLTWSTALLQQMQVAGPDAIADSAQQLTAATKGESIAKCPDDIFGPSPYTVRYGGAAI